MANYYLDIETTGLNPEINEIITIQFQELNSLTGEPVGDLIILKSWESSEEDILLKFNEKLKSAGEWGFIPHGYNLYFENKFLSVRGKIYGIYINLFERPYLDLHPLGIMMNNGFFKGSGLDKISGKESNGFAILELYSIDDWVSIENYIIQEAKEYIRLYVWLKKMMPKLRLEYQSELLSIKENRNKELGGEGKCQ